MPYMSRDNELWDGAVAENVKLQILAEPKSFILHWSDPECASMGGPFVEQVRTGTPATRL